MYPNHIPHNHLPLEELLNVKVQRGYSNNPQRAGIQWEGHDAKPETDVRILDASYSFILTWTDLFKIGTPRDLGLTDLLSECFDPGKQYSYYMDFADPNSVIITEKEALMRSWLTSTAPSFMRPTCARSSMTSMSSTTTR